MWREGYRDLERQPCLATVMTLAFPHGLPCGSRDGHDPRVPARSAWLGARTGVPPAVWAAWARTTPLGSRPASRLLIRMAPQRPGPSSGDGARRRACRPAARRSGRDPLSAPHPSPARRARPAAAEAGHPLRAAAGRRAAAPARYPTENRARYPGLESEGIARGLCVEGGAP